ncbi:hypothetical protein ES703_53536 [subsurface metagenome]
MLHHQTFLRCSQTTATFLFILIGILFLCIGCEQLYKTIGLTDEQIQNQVTQDQAAQKQIIEGIRLTTTELITTAIAGIGAIASGLLAKWLNTERKITKVLITGIEDSDQNTTKETVQTRALAAGIQPKLHARVKALT